MSEEKRKLDEWYEKWDKRKKQSKKQYAKLPSVDDYKKMIGAVLSKSENMSTEEDANDDSVVDEEKSYSHKPHLASLPYDHARGRTLEQLTERYNAITDRMKDLRKDREELVKKSSENSKKYREIKDKRDALIDQYKSMREDNQRFFDAEAKVLEKKKKVLDSIRDRMNRDVVIKEELRNRIEGLEKYFNTGWINQGNQSVFTDLANDLVDWRYTIEQDDNRWGNTVDGIADDIRVLADNEFFDHDLPKLYENSHTEDKFAVLIDDMKDYQDQMDTVLKEGKQISKDIKKLDKIGSDYFDDQNKIKWTAFKNGLLDDTMSEEEKQRANEYIKKHNL